ncbi:MAG: hypothetical protein QME92_11665, partial [Bacillota bacterium]|nr:hypothetical protein [Bacillota bacterium]
GSTGNPGKVAVISEPTLSRLMRIIGDRLPFNTVDPEDPRRVALDKTSGRYRRSLQAWVVHA